MSADAERLTLAAFLAACVLGGGNAVGVRFSNRELAPLWGAGLRFALAAAIFLAVMALMRFKFPRGRALTGALLYGLFNFGFPYALIYYGLVRIQAGLAQILLALVPLVTLLLAVLWHQERLRGVAVAGAVVAFAGVAVMSSATSQEGVPLLAVMAVIGGAVCFAQALVLIRRFPRVHPVTMNAVGMTAGAAMLLVASAIRGEAWLLPQRTETWVALGYLVLLGSVAVFLLYLFVLRSWTASRASYGFVLMPFVTLLLSAWLDGEPLSITLVLGGVLILTGVYVGALRAPSGEPHPTPTLNR